jgi:hypothetical protein
MRFTIKPKEIKMKLGISKYWLVTSYDDNNHLIYGILKGVSGCYRNINQKIYTIDKIIEELNILSPFCKIEFLEQTKKKIKEK